MGWVAASRSLTPALMTQLAGTVQGRVVAQNAKGIDLPPSKPGESGVSTQLSDDSASGSLVLRDAAGSAVRVLKFTRSSAGEENTAAAPASTISRTWSTTQAGSAP